VKVRGVRVAQCLIGALMLGLFVFVGVHLVGAIGDVLGVWDGWVPL
jgi:hypothetical protein